MSDMSHFSREVPIDPEDVRARLRKMSDAELLRFGKAARYMLFAGSESRQATARMFRGSVERSSERMETETCWLAVESSITSSLGGAAPLALLFLQSRDAVDHPLCRQLECHRANKPQK